VDNERYARYLDDSPFRPEGKLGQNVDRADQGSVLESKAADNKHQVTLRGLQVTLTDIKSKLGLQGLSHTSAILLALFVLLLCTFAVWNYSPSLQGMFSRQSYGDEPSLVKAGGSTDSASAIDDNEDSAELGSEGSTGTIYVYISGAVHQPDVYELESSARIIDVLNAAGGFLDSAAHEAVNLAAELDDGTQVHILTRKEFEEQGGGIAAVITNSSSSEVTGESNAGDGLVNLNMADSTTLQTLPGIGPVTADKVIADREANGPYSSLEDLTRVSGIGPKRVEGLEGIASVGP